MGRGGGRVELGLGSKCLSSFSLTPPWVFGDKSLNGTWGLLCQLGWLLVYVCPAGVSEACMRLLPCLLCRCRGWGLNLGPHACTASTILTEPSSQPFQVCSDTGKLWDPRRRVLVSFFFCQWPGPHRGRTQCQLPHRPGHVWHPSSPLIWHAQLGLPAERPFPLLPSPVLGTSTSPVTGWGEGGSNIE